MSEEPTPRFTRRRAIVTAAGAIAAAHPARALAQLPTTDLESLADTPGPALEPEIVTVTDTGFAAWWRTDEASDTTVIVEPLDGPEAGRVRELRLEEGRTVHAARVDGLRPGTRYRYELRSGGRRVSPGHNEEADPGAFRTLVRPPGPALARIAILNDMHVGERCSGTIKDTPTGSVPPCFTGDDYAFRMLEAAIAEIATRRVDLLVANGDLTDRGRDGEVRRALERLRSLGVPLIVTRGNHDRRLGGACAADGDCLRAQAYPGQPLGDAALRSVARVGGRVGVVVLDSADPDTGDGRLDLADQPRWLDAQLTQLGREGRIALVAFHHPILRETNPPGFSDKVDAGADAILAVLGRHAHVKLVSSGHTHRNNLGFDPDIGPRLPFLENGAIKEYPAGYALLDVHADGLMRTFHRPVTDFTREWVRTSAQEIYGYQPSVTRGSLTSRAFVTRFAQDRVEGAGVPRAAAPELRVRVLRRRTLGRFFERGLAVEVAAPAGTAVGVRLVAKLRGSGRSETVLVARGARKGSGRVRLRAPATTRRRLRRQTRSVSAIVQVRAGSRTVQRPFTLVVRR